MRRAGFVIGAAATAVLLTGCGDGETTVTITEGKGGGAELFDAMAKAQLEAETAAFDMSMTATIDGEERDLVQASGEMHVTSETTADMAMDMTMKDPNGSDVTTALNAIDGVIYTDMFQAMGAPIDTPWVSIDSADDDPVSKLFSGFFGSQQAMADISSRFAENSELLEVEEGETGTIDGTDATEYLVTVDVEDLAKIGGMSKSQLGTDPSQLPMDSVVYSIWVDDSYLPVEIAFDLDIQQANVAMDMNISGWGEPVTIEAPPESDVTDISKAMADVMGVDKVTEEQLEMLEQSFGA